MILCGKLLYITSAVVLVTDGVVSICTEHLTGRIGDTVEEVHISEAFIGIVLIPMVGNAAEHVTAVVAFHNKMDLAMGVAVSSSIQIALFITPLLVLVGWIMRQNMTL
jgi:Ca2+:H+ antiporter